MADKRKNNGGHPNCGRKSKAEELKLVERLGPLETKAFKALKKGIEVGDFKYVQLFYHYYAGKPKESKDITLNTEQPLFTLDKD
ncbi:MAG: hypothetical protein Unbinned5607contig1000_9 [Prokaryotic dsDNA virus sp.]|nr:MAG: hypothetical protein Unbinned5607contig1000_9 [Prokaryotic dsDNA virus sp.]|tara:strand:+ start:32319 stop:32570 length:252 start_codon:yes stop_codon:yes gene_type:complete